MNAIRNLPEYAAQFQAAMPAIRGYKADDEYPKASKRDDLKMMQEFSVMYCMGYEMWLEEITDPAVVAREMWKKWVTHLMEA